jgi:hypothetical protein
MEPRRLRTSAYQQLITLSKEAEECLALTQ